MVDPRNIQNVQSCVVNFVKKRFSKHIETREKHVLSFHRDHFGLKCIICGPKTEKLSGFLQFKVVNRGTTWVGGGGGMGGRGMGGVIGRVELLL